MAIEWRESLETGIKEIDLQHQELFARFNRLLDSCSNGQGREEVLKLLLFLDEYIKRHFADEELLQEQFRYAGYDAHKAQHRAFMAEVDRLEQEFRNAGATIALVVQTNRTMAEWLIQHIGEQDREFARFVKARRQAS